jgi:pimeloyl-ACP methyl ester carboxylesterase
MDNAPALQALLPAMDVVAPDHRGTGQSTWLGCDRNFPDRDLGADCMATVEARYGPDVGSYFSTTQAALDVDLLVRTLAAEGLEVYLYGESYGTFLVNRYLTLKPTGVAGAILDGVMRPDGRAGFLEGSVDFPYNHVARQVFDACGADDFCAGKLGPTPWDVLGALHSKLQAGHCAQALPPGTVDPSSWLRDALANAVALGAEQTALVYRLNRCAAADVAAVQHLWQPPAGDGGTGGGSSGSDRGTGCVQYLDGGTQGNCSGPPPTGTLQTSGTENLVLHFNIELSDAFRQHPPLEALADANAATSSSSSRPGPGSSMTRRRQPPGPSPTSPCCSWWAPWTRRPRPTCSATPSPTSAVPSSSW